MTLTDEGPAESRAFFAAVRQIWVLSCRCPFQAGNFNRPANFAGGDA